MLVVVLVVSPRPVSPRLLLVPTSGQGVLSFLFLADFAPTIRPPAEGWELVRIEGVVGVDVALLPKNKIANSSIEMEMEPYASAWFARPDSRGLNLAEVVGQPALELRLSLLVDAAASPWSHRNVGRLGILPPRLESE